MHKTIRLTVVELSSDYFFRLTTVRRKFNYSQTNKLKYNEY